jgi:hypothetical protein
MRRSQNSVHSPELMFTSAALSASHLAYENEHESAIDTRGVHAYQRLVDSIAATIVPPAT